MFSFSLSFGAVGFCITSLVYVCEVSGPRFRLLAVLWFYIARCLSYLLVSSISIFYPGCIFWLCTLGSLFCVWVMCKLEEVLYPSPRFLITGHAYEQATYTLVSISSYN